MLASLSTRHQQLSHHARQTSSPSYSQYWPSPSSSTTSISNSQPSTNNNTTANIFSFGVDQPLFDYQPNYPSSQPQSQPHMQSEHSNNSWLDNGQLTPKSTTRAHHRESSFSSLGSAGPASPYTANTSNPQVAGDLYHDFHDFQPHSSKPLTPAHTPSQEQFLTPHYSNFYHSNMAYTMGGHDGFSKQSGATDFNHSVGPSIVANDSPATPPGETNNDFRGLMPKLTRTVTDARLDELYIPSHQQITSAPTSSMPAPTVTVTPQNDVFSQRLQAANSQHLSASNTQAPLTIPSRDRSPFRQGSPLAPTGNNFQSQSPYTSARTMREQQKSESDARALQRQIERTSPEQTAPKTISPKDVDLIYHETEEDANTPLFPPQQKQRVSSNYNQQQVISHDPLESDDNASQRSYGSMATTRRESSSAYSTSSQATQQQGNFNFATPAVPGGARKIPQQYPFVPQTRRQPSNLSSVTEEFPATLSSMESSSSEYTADSSDIKRPSMTTADTGTYTCTYHGCTLRFDSPAKLQRHKREGHRNSAAAISGGDEGGMTSSAQRNSQAGPHKCERINPSTGKPCNTIFSRPYDLTRHEDTIHNARKQKVHCPLCTEEKTFSRNDALTRHLRVVHPEHVDMSKGRRRGTHD